MDKSQENYTQVLLEDIRSQFKAFGENLELVKEKGDATYEKVGELAEDIDMIKVELVGIHEELKEHSSILQDHSKILKEHTDILHEHSKTLNEHTAILNEHSEELHIIRHDLKEKIGRDEFKLLEDRVMRLEKLSLQSSH